MQKMKELIIGTFVQSFEVKFVDVDRGKNGESQSCEVDEHRREVRERRFQRQVQTGRKIFISLNCCQKWIFSFEDFNFYQSKKVD